MYVRLNQNIVKEIIPDINPTFPGVPIEKRYPESFLKTCIHVEDDTVVRTGMVYNPEDNSFSVPVVNVTPTIVNLDVYKTEKIMESKALLSEWLRNNPILYNGEYYSVTEEEQSLLNNNLASYERAKSADVEYTLKWNSTGNKCVEWAYEELVKLSLSIAEYVTPKVEIQQQIELDIKACETREDIDKIEISYD